MANELFGDKAKATTKTQAAELTKPEGTSEVTKPQEPTTAEETKKPEEVNQTNKVVTEGTSVGAAQTAIPTPVSLVPAAPLATQLAAEVNKEAMEHGQASTNPASHPNTPDNETNALQASEAARASQLMSEATKDSDEDENEDTFKPTPEQEMQVLQQRARIMGLAFSDEDTLDGLRDKIARKLNGDDEPDETHPVEGHDNVTGLDPETANVKPQVTGKKLSLRQHIAQEAMKLVRLRITNLDPKKKDLPGEILTVANEHLGTVRKFIPYGEVTDNGWHVEYCLYEQLRDRTFVSIKTRKGTRGEVIVENQNAKEFALEVLEPLTPDEMARLSSSQLAAGGVE